LIWQGPPCFIGCPVSVTCGVQVHKYLKLWKQLQLPELLGELASNQRPAAAAPALAKRGAKAQRSGAQGLLIVQRLRAGGSSCLLLPPHARGHTPPKVSLLFGQAAGWWRCYSLRSTRRQPRCRRSSRWASSCPSA
jgi:hypothetical protein